MDRFSEGALPPDLPGAVQCGAKRDLEVSRSLGCVLVVLNMSLKLQWLYLYEDVQNSVHQTSRVVPSLVVTETCNSPGTHGFLAQRLYQERNAYGFTTVNRP